MPAREQREASDYSAATPAQESYPLVYLFYEAHVVQAVDKNIRS
jgi:hypothetical protein